MHGQVLGQRKLNSLSDFKTVVQADSLQCFIWHTKLKSFFEPVFKNGEISVKTLDFQFFRSPGSPESAVVHVAEE